jgi:uncharacterized protein YjbI with pentapeptide repeats
MRGRTGVPGEIITDLTGAKLTNTVLMNADLTNVNLDGQAQLDQACGTDAKLPAGMTLKPCSEPRRVAPPLNRDGTP